MTFPLMRMQCKQWDPGIACPWRNCWHIGLMDKVTFSLMSSSMLQLVSISYMENIYLDGIMVCMHGALENVSYTLHF